MQDIIDFFATLSKKTWAAIVLGTVLAYVVLSSFYVIDASERGVVLRNGAFKEVADPGLNFKLPVIETVKILSMQQQTSLYQQVPAYSADQQTATMDVSITWQPDPSRLRELYESFKDVETMEAKLLTRNVGNALENTFGGFTAARAVQKRGEFVKGFNAAITANAKGPIIVVSTQVENIDFSSAYENAIATRMAAEVEIATRTQKLETEKVQATILVTQSQAQADSKLALAEADAKSIILRGEAEATAIKARADALAANDRLVELTKAERWNGTLPTHMMPGSAIPFFNTK